MTPTTLPIKKTHAQFSFVAVTYASNWFKANGYEVQVSSDDLQLLINGHIIEVSHSEIRNRAIDWLESELEGIKGY